MDDQDAPILKPLQAKHKAAISSPPPSQEDFSNKPPEKKGTSWLPLILIIGLPLLAVAFFGGSGSDSPERSTSQVASSSSSRSEPKLDSGGKLACRDYRGVMRDLDRGILTDSEFRSKVQSANRNAEISDDRQLRSSSESLLRALTTGTNQQAADAVIAIHNRCEYFGH